MRNALQDVMDDANIDTIDYFITSHYHRDHVDGLPTLANRILIRQFIDHGDSVEQDLPNGKLPGTLIGPSQMANDEPLHLVTNCASTVLSFHLWQHDARFLAELCHQLARTLIVNSQTQVLIFRVKTPVV